MNKVKKQWFVILAILIVSISSILYFSFNPIVFSFSFQNYKEDLWEFEQYRRDDLVNSPNVAPDVFDQYDQIKTGKEALKAAKNIWNEFYDDAWLHQPYCVYYDKENRVWLVTSGLLRGGPNLLIDTEGNVLDMWKERL